MPLKSGCLERVTLIGFVYIPCPGSLLPSLKLVNCNQRTTWCSCLSLAIVNVASVSLGLILSHYPPVGLLWKSLLWSGKPADLAGDHVIVRMHDFGEVDAQKVPLQATPLRKARNMSKRDQVLVSALPLSCFTPTRRGPSSVLGPGAAKVIQLGPSALSSSLPLFTEEPGLDC